MIQAKKTRVAAAFVAMTLVAGCKIMDGGVDSGFSGEGNAQDGRSEIIGSAPIIWGDPETTVLVGQNYLFQPETEDADGDLLEFNIENRPDWALFDPATGTLQGVPTASHRGRHGNIVISATDSDNVVSLPSFSIMVADTSTPDDGIPDDGIPDDGIPDDGIPDDGGPGQSSSAPPTISGKPNTSVVAGQQYVFRPDAIDPEGDDLSFSVVNKPSWANFNTTTGRLGGYPDFDDVGTSRLIEISVSDGSSIAALPRFRVTVEPVGTASVTLAWDTPTRNADGSLLTDLAGYRIYYGTASGDYTETIAIRSAGVTSHVIDGLAPGRYYLAMTSVNSQDLESDKTPEIEIDTGS